MHPRLLRCRPPPSLLAHAPPPPPDPVPAQHGQVAADDLLRHLVFIMLPAQIDLLCWILDLINEIVAAQRDLPDQKRAVRQGTLLGAFFVVFSLAHHVPSHATAPRLHPTSPLPAPQQDHRAFARLFSAVSMHLDDDRQENMEAFESTFMALFRIAPTIGRVPETLRKGMQGYTEAEADVVVAQFFKKKGRRSRSIGTALSGLGSAASGMVDVVARRGRSTHL